jgi:hypothetical protein
MLHNSASRGFVRTAELSTTQVHCIQQGLRMLPLCHVNLRRLHREAESAPPPLNISTLNLQRAVLTTRDQ